MSLGCFCLDCLGLGYSETFSHAYVIAAKDGTRLSVHQPGRCAHWCHPSLRKVPRTSLLLQDTELCVTQAFVVAPPLGTKWKGYVLTGVICSAGDPVFQVQWGLQAFAAASGFSHGCWDTWTRSSCINFKQFTNRATSPAHCLFRGDMKSRFHGQETLS